jgi:DNA primase
LSVVEDIKQKLDIVEVIGQYVQLNKSGRMFRAPCPFHNEKRPSFFVYPEQQSWHCFGACNTGGDLFSFVMKKEGIDFGEALRLLADKAGVVVPTHANSQAEDSARDKVYQSNQAAAQYFSNLLLNSPAAEKARNYIERRGVSPKSVADFQLGYSPNSWEGLKQYLTEKGYTESELMTAGLIVKSDAGKVHDRFHNQLMFPIQDDRGRIAGFGARVLDESLPKYINSPQTPVFDKSGSLYGIHLARPAIRKENLAVLVEGYMDVIFAHQYGFQNVVAPMGTAITERQINQIKKLTRHIALALDPDAAGEEAALRCVGYENALDAEVKVITLPTGKDPDEVIKEDAGNWVKAVEKAVPVIEYSINSITAKLDVTKTADKTQAINKILPIIAEVKAGPRQYDYLTKLSLKVGISDRRLEEAMGEYRAVRKAREPRDQVMQKVTRNIGSNPIEEYCLSLLLQHPELKANAGGLEPDYFESSENNYIYSCLRNNQELEKEKLDPAVLEHFEALSKRNIPPDRLEEKLAEIIARLKEKYLRNLEIKRKEKFAVEKSGGTADDIQEHDLDVCPQLKDIFNLRGKTPKEVNYEK